jgi:hypothetical protein
MEIPYGCIADRPLSLGEGLNSSIPPACAVCVRLIVITVRIANSFTVKRSDQ